MSLVKLTDNNFDTLLDDHDVALILFTADWCAPCHHFLSVYEAAALNYPNILFTTVDIERESNIANDFNVRSVPTLAILRQRTVVYLQSGTMMPTTLDDLISQACQLNLSDVE